MDLAASESSKEHVAHTRKPCVHLAPDALQTMHAPTRGGLDVAIGGRGSLLLDAGTLAATLMGSGTTAEPDLLWGGGLWDTSAERWPALTSCCAFGA